MELANRPGLFDYRNCSLRSRRGLSRSELMLQPVEPPELVVSRSERETLLARVNRSKPETKLARASRPKPETQLAGWQSQVTRRHSAPASSHLLPARQLASRWHRLQACSRPRPVNVFRRWLNPDPSAFCPETRGVRTNNLAAHCGARPICDRCRKRRNRRAPVACGSRRSRWPHKRAGRDQPYRTFGWDKRRCLPRPPADRDGRSAS